MLQDFPGLLAESAAGADEEVLDRAQRDAERAEYVAVARQLVIAAAFAAVGALCIWLSKAMVAPKKGGLKN